MHAIVSNHFEECIFSYILQGADGDVKEEVSDTHTHTKTHT